MKTIKEIAESKILKYEEKYKNWCEENPGKIMSGYLSSKMGAEWALYCDEVQELEVLIKVFKGKLSDAHGANGFRWYIEAIEEIREEYKEQKIDNLPPLITKDDIINLGFKWNKEETVKQWEDFIYSFQRKDGDDSDKGWMDGYRHFTEIIFRTNCNLCMIKRHSFGGFTGNQHNSYVTWSGELQSIEQLKNALEETSVINSFSYNTKHTYYRPEFFKPYVE